MKFDGNRAWGDATRAIAANREVLLVMAGVFFFLPALAAALFLSGYQSEMQANLAALSAAEPGNTAVLQPFLRSYARVAPYLLGLLLINAAGYMAMLALLTDRRRPTVGEAMGIALRCLPALIGTILVFTAGYFLALIPLGLLLGGLIAVAGKATAMTAGVIAVLGLLALVATRLSLTLPVIVIEGQHNPLSALGRSWRMSAGNGWRLFAFYLLLVIAYLVIALSLTAVTKLAVLPLGGGEPETIISGAVSGLIGAVAAVVLTAILAAIHRQLSGPSPDPEGRPFR